MPAESNEIDSAGPAPDYNASVDFLKWHAPQGMWVLMAIATDKKSINTQTFVPADEHLLRAWLKEHGSKNIYFHVNPTTRPLRKKAEREDVKELAWLHVDIDPRVGEDTESERARALGSLQNPRDGIPKPSAIIFSGGGYQGFWRLEDAITKARLVYWRVKDPLPGREAFTVIGPGDERVDMSALATKYGPLPTDPKAQNTLWYRIYKSVESDPGVEHAHREFLFARDYCFLSALMLAGLGGLSVLTFIGAGKALLYLAILIMQFVITGQAARNHGRRLISTVLAVAGAKEA